MIDIGVVLLVNPFMDMTKPHLYPSKGGVFTTNYRSHHLLPQMLLTHHSW